MPYSSAVWETNAIERSGSRPASRKARASSRVTATPVASSKAALNQPSWWPATISGAPRARPGRIPTTFAASAPRVSGAWSTTLTLPWSLGAFSLRIVTHGGASACQMPSKVPRAFGAW